MQSNQQVYDKPQQQQQQQQQQQRKTKRESLSSLHRTPSVRAWTMLVRKNKNFET